MDALADFILSHCLSVEFESVHSRTGNCDDIEDGGALVGVAVSVAVGNRREDDTSRREDDSNVEEPHFQGRSSRDGAW